MYIVLLKYYREVQNLVWDPAPASKYCVNLPFHSGKVSLEQWYAPGMREWELVFLCKIRGTQVEERLRNHSRGSTGESQPQP